ncbi:uncharacterized protein LOC131846822 [Achroia grisella]|uniref:uncharacterized protein LOC131846822 n=1 Tax=Achroia grisella TaxID=688607 RepID=UPI0027D33A16|nr:uncharacterized protein LOC131846822 [Achroia grisella]
MWFIQYPAPAVVKREDNESNPEKKSIDITNGESIKIIDKETTPEYRPPGTLPNSANMLTNASRGLLLRLLERDPRVRMRNLRQLQQSAFYMGFNFEHVKARKMSPKIMFEHYFPDGLPETSVQDLKELNALFDQAKIQ